MGLPQVIVDPDEGSTGSGGSAPSLNSTVKNVQTGSYTIPIGVGSATGYVATTVVPYRALVYDSDGREYWAYFDKNYLLVYKEPTGYSKLEANLRDKAAGSGGGGSGGGSSAATLSMGDKEAFFDWMGRNPTAAESAKIATEGWTADTLRRYAVKNGGTGRLMQQAKNLVRQIAAPFYNGDPTAIPDSLVNSLISSGDYEDSEYLTNTYFPTLRGVGATNPLAAGYVDAWNDLVGGDRPLSNAAITKMNELIKVYGFSEVGISAFNAWAKTTEAAYTGAYGAEHRAMITDMFTSLLGRNPSQVELSQGSIYWGMEGDQLEEAIMQLPEAKAIYKYKPAWEQPLDYLARLRGIDATLKWYYGDHFTPSANGSLTYVGKTPAKVSTGIPDIPAYDPKAAGSSLATTTVATAPTWKSLTNSQFAIDLQTYGVTVKDGKYYKGAQMLSMEQLDELLPDDTYYRDDKGFHYVQEEGALDKYGNPALITKKKAVA